MTDAQTAPRGRWSRLVGRWTTPQSEVEAQRLREDTHVAGAQEISACPRGEPATVYGTLRSVILRPRAGVPALEAELYDGSGTIRLIWLGRRRIGGIEPGRTLVATGRVTCHEDEPMMFNPRYELKPLRSE
ncbi:MAG: OB-fold nucleic acid binding domain-containing protein [Candidatus Nanopelagicales bacterium]